MARHYTGDNDILQWADPTFMDGESQISVHVFAKFDTDFSASQSVACKRIASAPDTGFEIRVNRTPKFFFVMDDGVDTVQITCAAGPSLDVWYSLGFTFEANSATGLKVYIDGSEDAKSPGDATDVDAFVDNNQTLRMGRIGGGSYDMKGDIGELAIWTGTILTEAEFAALAAGKPAFRVQPSSLDFYCPAGYGGAAGPDPDFIGGLSGTLGGSTLPTVSGSPYIIRPDTSAKLRAVRGILRGVA